MLRDGKSKSRNASKRQERISLSKPHLERSDWWGYESKNPHQSLRSGWGLLVSSKHRQRMPAIAQRQIKRRPQPRRLIHREDHLQRRPAIVHASLGLPVALDGFEQILRDPDIAQAEPAVFHGFRLANALAGDLLPGGTAAAGEPRGIR